MATDALDSSRASAGVAQILDGLEYARARTFALIEHLEDDQLERVYSPIMSPLVWDLGHIAAYEDLWLAHRLGEHELLRPELAALYDAFETPRAVRGDIETLGPDEAREYLAEVRARTVQTLGQRGVGDGVICEMVVRHELQHGETMRQTMVIAGLLGEADAATRDRPLPGPSQSAMRARRLQRRTGSRCRPGTSRWARRATASPTTTSGPATSARRRAFRSPAARRRPRSWLRFAELGGYERRELVVGGGLGVARRVPAAAGGRGAPGDRRGASAGARLSRQLVRGRGVRAGARRAPAERGRVGEGGDAGRFAAGRSRQGVGVDRDARSAATRASSRTPTASTRRCSSARTTACCAGGSWATDARVAGPHFRNWDLPQRRQIFAGVRLARDGG